MHIALGFGGLAFRLLLIYALTDCLGSRVLARICVSGVQSEQAMALVVAHQPLADDIPIVGLLNLVVLQVVWTLGPAIKLWRS